MDPLLRTLIDEREIVGLAVLYCRCLDRKDFDGLSEVFLDDATAVLGGPDVLEGIDAIAGRCRAALESLDDSQHLVGTHEVEVDGDTATHWAYLQAQHIRRSADGGPHYLVGGRYEDRVVRTEFGWRIAHRTLHVMWTDGNPEVVRGD